MYIYLSSSDGGSTAGLHYYYFCENDLSAPSPDYFIGPSVFRTCQVTLTDRPVRRECVGLSVRLRPQEECVAGSPSSGNEKELTCGPASRQNIAGYSIA